MTENYAILRIGKIKMSNVNAVAFHNLRLSEVPNADPSLSHKNQVLIGSRDLKGDLKKHLALNGIEKFRLSRGVKKSRVHHQSIKTFYGILDDAKNLQREDKELKRTYKVPYKDYEKKNFFGRNTGTISIADAKKLNKSILNTHNRILDRDIIGPNESKRVSLAVGMRAQNNKMRELMRTNSKLQAQNEKMLAAQTLVNSLEDLGLMPQVKNILGQSVRERAKLDNEAKQASAARIRENVPAFGVADITMRPEDEKEEMKMKSAPTPKFKPR